MFEVPDLKLDLHYREIQAAFQHFYIVDIAVAAADHLGDFGQRARFIDR